MAKKKAKDPIGEAINKEFKKLGDTITKPIKTEFTKLGDAIAKPFKQIIGYFKCGIDKIKNIPNCAPFYSIDIVFGVWFLFWGMLATVIPGLKDVGKMVSKGINYLDSNIKKNAGFHINRYSKNIMNKCYKCPK
jgi:hypothetical protein